jgi:hypothetical protein
MLQIKLQLTKEQAQNVIETLCPLKYDEATGQNYVEVPEWLYVLRYFASDADGLDKLIGSCLLDIRHAS